MFSFIRSLFSKKQDYSSNAYSIGNCNVTKFKGWSGKTEYRFDLIDEKGEQIGFILGSLYDKVVSGKYVKVFNLDRSFIKEMHQGKGFGKQMYSAMAKAWHLDPHFNGAVFERYFINPVAYRLARWLVDSAQLPESTWDERFIVCAFEEIAS